MSEAYQNSTAIEVSEYRVVKAIAQVYQDLGMEDKFLVKVELYGWY